MKNTTDARDHSFLQYTAVIHTEGKATLCTQESLGYVSKRKFSNIIKGWIKRNACKEAKSLQGNFSSGTSFLSLANLAIPFVKKKEKKMKSVSFASFILHTQPEAVWCSMAFTSPELISVNLR